MDRVPFYKMSGSGNDFIVIDNRMSVMDEALLERFIVNVCRRRLSAGADGVILIENSDAADFKWRFYNADASRAEMCGNGARCAARYAFVNGIAGPRMAFETDVGIVSAEIMNGRVKVKMTAPSGVDLARSLTLESGPITAAFVNTGVPHVVVEARDIEQIEVVARGREIRHHAALAPAGANVNFITPLADGTIAIRTYERGVEDETLACGTGSIASALVTALRGGQESPIDVKTRSGSMLTVHFRREGDRFKDVYLEGDARIVYSGEMWADAWAL